MGMSLFASVTGALSQATASASGAAERLARASSPQPSDPGIASDFVTLSQSSTQVSVAVKLAQVAQQMDRSVLDIVA